MNSFLKLVRWVFPNRFRETKEQELLVEQTSLLSRTYPRIAVAMSLGCFMQIDTQNEIPTPKQQNRNNEALKSAQQILEKIVKILSSFVNAIRNKMRQPTENGQTKKVVPAPECRTSFETLKTRQKTRCDKFSETVPKAFAPP
jgi:hypothetical protein